MLSIDLTASFKAKVDLYRIKIPDEILDELKTENTTVELEVIPSDLLRLVEIGGRLAEPYTIEIEIADGDTKVVEFNAEGFEELVDNYGKIYKKDLYKAADEISNQEKMIEIDLSKIRIITNLDNLGGIGING